MAKEVHRIYEDDSGEYFPALCPECDGKNLYTEIEIEENGDIFGVRDFCEDCDYEVRF